MKKKCLSLALALCLLLGMTAAFTPVAARAAVNYEFVPGAGWRLIWRDEFDGNDPDGKPSAHLNERGVNLNNWGFHTGDGSAYNIPGWGNQEMESYHPDFARVNEQGQLVMSARKMGYAGEPIERNKTAGYNATWWSTKLKTSVKDYEGDDKEYKPTGFAGTYGRFEARIKLPSGSGWWPAFWLLPEDNVYGTWAASGEIDIMEVQGGYTHMIGGALHFGGMWPSNTYTNRDCVITPDTTTEFHVYAIEWEQDQIRYFFDDYNYFTVNHTQWYTSGAYDNPYAPFDQDFHIILNLAVGGTLGHGEPAGPGEMVVDYVRVYEQVVPPEIRGVIVTPAQIYDDEDSVLNVTVQGQALDQLQITVGVEGYPNTFVPLGSNKRAAINISAGELAPGNYHIIVRESGVPAGYTAGFKVISPGTLPREGASIYLVSKTTGQVVGSADRDYAWTGLDAQTTLRAVYEPPLDDDPYTTYKVQYKNDRVYLRAGNGKYVTIENQQDWYPSLDMVRPRSDGGPGSSYGTDAWEALIFEEQDNGTIKIRRTGTDGGRWVDVLPGGDLKSVTNEPGESGEFYWYPVGRLPGDPFTLNRISITFSNANPVPVIVANTGAGPTGALSVTLSGTNADVFKLSAASVASLAPGGNANFTVAPDAGLTAPGTYTAVVTVGNDEVGYKTINLSYTILPPPPPVITAAALPGGTEGVPYSAALTATGSGPIAWSLDGGALPSGLTLSADGVISGTPDAAGIYEFTVKAENSGGYVIKALSITIKPVVNYGVDLDQAGTYQFPNATEGYGPLAALSVRVTNAGIQPTGALDITLTGAGAGAFQLSDGNIPNIAVGGNANFTVAPATDLIPGIYTATVTVSNANVPAESFIVSFTVDPAVSPPSIITGALPDGKTGSYYSAALTATGDTPITWSRDSGSLPPGLTLSAGGVISGTPSAAGTYAFAVRAANAGGYMTKPLTVVIAEGGGDIQFTQSSFTWNDVPAGYTQNQIYSVGFVFVNMSFDPSGPLTVSITGPGKDAFGVSPMSFPGLDAWGNSMVNIIPVIGLSPGVYTATVTMTGAPANSLTLSVTVTGAPAPPVITTSLLPGGTVGVPYYAALTAEGSPPFFWILDGGALPDGLALSSNGVISGTPSAAGTYHFTVAAHTAAGADYKTLTIPIYAAPKPPYITTGSLPRGAVDQSYDMTLAAAGDPPIAWSLESGALPDGLALSAAGVISGTPSVAGTFEFTVKASNTAGSSGRALFIVIEGGSAADGVAVTGLVRSYSPNRVTTLKLMRGSEVMYTTAIAATPGFGQVTQPFAFTGVAPGEYSLIATKDTHTSFTVQTVIVGDTDLDLTQDSRDAVKVMTLLCGDINGDRMINDNDLIVLWQAANYNKNIEQAANPLCDLNGDGVINDNDLIILWLAVNYNKGPVVVV